MPRESPGSRFVLASSPLDGPPRLAPDDERHAVRVLRIAPGDRLEGLDGEGAAWPLRVAGVGRRELALEVDGEPRREPRPGADGASRPHVEVALSLPKGSRAEDCFNRLTQLGVALLTPLVTERSASQARDAGAARLERLARVGREASKQCGRLWFPAVGAPVELDAWLAERRDVALAWLDPRAETSILAWEAPGAEHRLALAVGPEGGFTPNEEAALAAHGARRLRLGGHVLRIETAAEAALAIVAAIAERRAAARE